MKTQQMTRKRLTPLALLLAGLMILSQSVCPVGALAQDLNIKLKTQLDVKQENGSWDKNVITISNPQTLTFRWATREAGVAKGVWQVSEANAGIKTDKDPSFFLATGAAGVAPPPNRFTLFTVDTSQFLPPKPTKTVKKYYLRLVPLNASDGVVGFTSVSVVINYVQQPEQPGSITITKEDVYGTYAVIYFTASTPITAYGEAGTKSPGVDDIFTPADVVSTASQKINAPLTQNAVWLTGLRPNTNYYYVIIGKDKDGKTLRSAAQTFKTKQQRVSVTFQKISVQDDSDDLSAGDLGIGIYVGNSPGSSNPTLVYLNSIDSGAEVALNANDYTAVAMNPPDPITITARGFDDDESDIVVIFPIFIKVLNSCGTPPAGNPGGDCRDGDFAEASTTISITKGFDEPFSIPVIITANGPKLKFKVFGTLSVSYVD